MTDWHDPEAVEKAEDWQRAADEWLIDGYRRMLNDPQGRAVLADIVASTGAWHPSYQPGDPIATAYAEGRRSVGLEIARKLMLLSPHTAPDTLNMSLGAVFNVRSDQ